MKGSAIGLQCESGDREATAEASPIMDEMDVDAVDIGDEVRIGVDPALDLSPVVLVEPVVGELLDRRELHALRCIVDQLPVGPSRGRDTALHVGKFIIGRVEAEGPYGCV